MWLVRDKLDVRSSGEEPTDPRVPMDRALSVWRLVFGRPFFCFVFIFISEFVCNGGCNMCEPPTTEGANCPWNNDEYHELFERSV